MKRKTTNIIKRITNSKLSPKDEYTIQGFYNDKEHTDYYIKNPYLQQSLGNPSYTSVRLLHQDEEKNLYVYIGIVLKAGNAIGVLQTDKPIEEILASPQGNEIFTQMLQKEYAEQQLQNSWKEQGVEIKENEPRLFKPSFNLGNIYSSRNYFELSSEMTPQIKSILDKEKEKTSAIQKRISEKDVLVQNGDLVIGNAYIERVSSPQSHITEYSGTNLEAINYTYSNVRLLKKSKDSYFYVGKLTTGNNKKTNTNEKIISLENNEKTYTNTVIELPKPIDTIITEHHLDIDLAFGETFMDHNLENKTETLENGSTYTYAGKIEQSDEYEPYTLSTESQKLDSDIVSLISDVPQTNKRINFPSKRSTPDEPDID